MIESEVKGLSELNKFLQQLPVKMERSILRGALRAGAKVIATQAKANVPVSSGALKNSIRVTGRAKGGKVSASVKAGGKIKKTGQDAWYAHIVEFTGAVPHQIVSKLGGSLFIGGLFSKSVDHPGMKARPFLRPALDSQATNAVVAVGKYIRSRLTKQGLNASSIKIGDE